MQDSQNPLTPPKDTSFMDFKGPNAVAPNPTSRPIVGGQGNPQPDPMISSPLINPASTTAAAAAPIPAAAPVTAPVPTPSPVPAPVSSAPATDVASEPPSMPSISEDDSTTNDNPIDIQPTYQAPATAPSAPVTPAVAATPDKITAPATTTDTPKKKGNMLMDFVVIVVLLIIIAGLVYVIKYKSSSL